MTTPDHPPLPVKTTSGKRKFFLGVAAFLVIALALGFTFFPRTGIFKARPNHAVQTCRTIGLALYSYASDHHGKYPEGGSSTAIFQQLLDENYLSDPAIFYLPFPGKVKLTSGKSLKPENVAWDVTSGLDSTTPDSMPVIFSTGFKVNYVPGGSAVPILRPIPALDDTRTWSQYWRGEPKPKSIGRGIAVSYKRNSAEFMRSSDPTGLSGEIPYILPATFDPQDKVYRQLTPDGILP